MYKCNLSQPQIKSHFCITHSSLLHTPTLTLLRDLRSITNRYLDEWLESSEFGVSL
jgi:hypothetical protein